MTTTWVTVTWLTDDEFHLVQSDFLCPFGYLYTRVSRQFIAGTS